MVPNGPLCEVLSGQTVAEVLKVKMYIPLRGLPVTTTEKRVNDFSLSWSSSSTLDTSTLGVENLEGYISVYNTVLNVHFSHLPMDRSLFVNILSWILAFM